MKAGDLVRYTVMILPEDFKKSPDNVFWKQGLLIEFNKIQRLCIILNNDNGELIKRHCSDVQLVKVGHENR